MKENIHSGMGCKFSLHDMIFCCILWFTQVNFLIQTDKEQANIVANLSQHNLWLCSI